MDDSSIVVGLASLSTNNERTLASETADGVHYAMPSPSGPGLPSIPPASAQSSFVGATGVVKSKVSQLQSNLHGRIPAANACSRSQNDDAPSGSPTSSSSSIWDNIDLPDLPVSPRPTQCSSPLFPDDDSVCPGLTPYSWMTEHPGQIPRHPPKLCSWEENEIRMELAIRETCAYDPDAYFSLVVCFGNIMHFRARQL